MIKYILIGITILLVFLLGYTQTYKDTETRKETINGSTENKVSKDTHTLEVKHTKVPKQEKEIIKKILAEKENLTRTYNAEEELNIPTEIPSDMDLSENDNFMTQKELDYAELASGLRPNVEYDPSSVSENIPITEDRLEELEISAGLQDITSTSNDKPLEAEGFQPL